MAKKGASFSAMRGEGKITGLLLAEIGRNGEEMGIKKRKRRKKRYHFFKIGVFAEQMVKTAKNKASFSAIKSGNRCRKRNLENRRKN